MKITKRSLEDGRIWIGRCRVCKSEAEAKQSEMTHVTYDMRDNISFSWEKCPVCEAGEESSGYGGMLFYPKKD